MDSILVVKLRVNNVVKRKLWKWYGRQWASDCEIMSSVNKRDNQQGRKKQVSIR